MPHLLLSVWLIVLSAILQGDRSDQPVSPFPAGFSFTGSWDCSGTFRGNKMHRATFKGEIVLGGTWLALTEEDVEPNTGYQATYLIGYDFQQHQLIEFDANTFGAKTYRSTQGWQDGVLTMEPMGSTSDAGKSNDDRFIYSVSHDHTFTVNWQVKGPPQFTWNTADHLLCRNSLPG